MNRSRYAYWNRVTLSYPDTDKKLSAASETLRPSLSSLGSRESSTSQLLLDLTKRHSWGGAKKVLDSTTTSSEEPAQSLERVIALYSSIDACYDAGELIADAVSSRDSRKLAVLTFGLPGYDDRDAALTHLAEMDPSLLATLLPRLLESCRAIELMHELDYPQAALRRRIAQMLYELGQMTDQEYAQFAAGTR